MANRILNKLDHQRLVQRIDADQTNRELYSVQLKGLLSIDNTTLLEPSCMPTDVVTMYSVVSLEYIDTGRKLDICLVYPEDADAEENRISILAPIASALLGYKRGTLTNLPTPFGSVTLLIRQILYQPEAAGDFLR